MTDLGVITPISEPSEWVSSMVAAHKNNSNNIRICIDPRVRLLFYHGNEVLYFWLCIKDEAVTVFTMVRSNLHPNSSSCYSELKLLF